MSNVLGINVDELKMKTNVRILESGSPRHSVGGKSCGFEDNLSPLVLRHGMCLHEGFVHQGR